MSSNPSDKNYIRAEDRIYDIALNKDELDWRGFLHDLIYKENLDPWDIDLGIFTKKYLESIKELSNVDFDVSGKFLTIAVFLLKTKAENYVEHDLRGIDRKIAEIERNTLGETIADEWGSLEEFDLALENLNEAKKKEKYSIKVRNPIARKRKVNIFDLIKVLEKTFEQSNRRRANFFVRNQGGEYDGPMYEKKPKDLKQIIEELHNFIIDEFENKKGHITFSYLIDGIEHRKGILEKFIPLLHLENQNKVTLKQTNHFGDIEIHKVINSEDNN